MDSKQRAIFNIGYTCNNNCRFCAIAKNREMIADLTTAQIKEKIKQAHDDGKSELIFSGGEPTVRPDIIRLVRYAWDLGFRHIETTTNGRMFSYKPFAQKIVRAGMHFFRFSIHGHDEATHEYLTRAPGSFKEATTGIRNITDLGKEWEKHSSAPLYTEITTAIVQQNSEHILNIVKLAGDLGVGQCNFNFVIPWGSAWIHKKNIVMKISDAIPHITEAIEYDKKNRNIVKKIANIPFCFLTGYENYISEVAEGKIDIINPRGKPFDYQGHRRDMKNFGKQCTKCRYLDVCEGLYTEYIELYGTDELIPVP